MKDYETGGVAEDSCKDKASHRGRLKPSNVQLSCPSKHHAMMTCRWVEVKFQIFLTSVPSLRCVQLHAPTALPPEKALGTLRRGDKKIPSPRRALKTGRNTKLLQLNQITYRYNCWKLHWKQTSARKSKIDVLFSSCHIYTRNNIRYSVRYRNNCQKKLRRKNNETIVYFTCFQPVCCKGRFQGLSEFPQLRSKHCSFDICSFLLIPATFS